MALVAGLVEHVLVALETLQNDASVTIQNLVKINVIRQIKTISHCFCWDVDIHEPDRLNYILYLVSDNLHLWLVTIFIN